MKYAVMMLFLCLSLLTGAQNTQSSVDQIRKQMQQIRQNTNWDDPAAAKKANEEIQKLVKQMTGQSAASTKLNAQTKSENSAPVNFVVKTALTSENIVAIADCFYKRSYNALDAISKFKFDQNLKDAEKAKFNKDAIRKLGNIGAELISFGE